MNTLRRSFRSAIVFGALAALALAGTGSAAYPPGPFPGPAPVGAFPTVVVSSTICGTGQVRADDGAVTVTIDVPTGAFGECTQVTVYGMSGEALSLLLPSGKRLLSAYAVGWDGSAAMPLTMTIEDPAIRSGSIAYRTSGSGLVVDATAHLDTGRASTDVSEPTGFVLAAADGEVAGATSPPLPATTTAEPPGQAPAGGEISAVFAALAAICAATVLLVGWRRRRSAD